MKRPPGRSCVFFLTAALGLVECTPVQLSEKHLTVVCDLDPRPLQVGPATVNIRLADAQGGSVTGARLTIEGDMTHPGMNPVFAKAAEIAPGQYRGQLTFTMPGDWAVLIHGTAPGGQAIERQFDIGSVGHR